MKQVLFGVTGSNPAGTEYQSIMGTGGVWNAEATARSPAPAPGVLRNLVVEVATAPGVGNSRTVTLRKGGAGTALTVTISDTATTARLTGTDVTIATGDLLALQATPTGTPASTGWRWSLEFEGSTAKESAYTQMIGAANFNAATRYTGVFTGATTIRTVATETQNLVAAAGALVRTTAIVNTAPGVGNGLTFYVNLNGVRQDGTGATVNTTCALTGAITAVTATYSLPLVAGDVVYMELVAAGAFSTRNWALGTAFVATTDGEAQLCGHTMTGALSATLTQYRPAFGVDVSLNVSETLFTMRALGGVTAITLSGFRVLLGTAPGGSASRTIDLRKNAASIGPTVTVAAGATTGTDAVTSGTISDGDLWNLRSVPTSTPAASTLAWAFVQRTATSAVARSTPFVGPLIVSG